MTTNMTDDQIEAQLNEARSALAAGDGARAVATLNALLREAPETVDGLLLMAECAYHARHLEASLTLLENAQRLAPERPDIAFQLGCVIAENGDKERACTLYEKVVALDPTHINAWINLGNQYKHKNQLVRACSAYRYALECDPSSTMLKTNLGAAYQAQGFHAEALPLLRQAAEETNDPIAASAYLMGLNYADAKLTSVSSIAQAHLDWGRGFEAQFEPLSVNSETMDNRGPSHTLRIGFMSADIANHPVGRFLDPLLALMADQNCTPIIIKLNPATDPMAETLIQSADHTLEASMLSDDTLAAKIQDLKLDLLVDLSGHTSGARLGVLARKPAPIQATWLGYPNTTGLRRVDYRFSDPYADKCSRQEDYSEQLIEIEDGFLCYRPPVTTPLEGRFPASNTVTFGSFNNFTKLNNQVLLLWARLLRAAPDSHLMLKAKGLADTETRQRVTDIFQAEGVAPNRLILLPPTTSIEESFALYANIDIALDPFPYNGTTTTFDALWMGRPVIALDGDSHVSRVSASIVTGIGFPEWVASDEEDYIAKALAVAEQIKAGSLKPQDVRDALQRSPWMDEPGFARRFCAAARRMVTAKGPK